MYYCVYIYIYMCIYIYIYIDIILYRYLFRAYGHAVTLPMNPSSRHSKFGPIDFETAQIQGKDRDRGDNRQDLEKLGHSRSCDVAPLELR